MSVDLSHRLHVNYRYSLNFAERQRNESPTFRILDYGCGAGEVVMAGRERGLDFYGAEVFYAGGNTRDVVERNGLLGTTVKEIHDGHLDFPDAFFDLVVNNQVFEHVENLDGVLGEIYRVLKPGGKVLSLFPSRDTVREPHCGIPFLHWFSKSSKLRYPYTLMLRRLGLGFHKGERTAEQWTTFQIQWVDTYCFYRTRENVMNSFRRFFDAKLIEEDFISFRLQDSNLGWVDRFTSWPILRPVAKELLRRFGFLVIVAEKL